MKQVLWLAILMVQLDASAQNLNIEKPSEQDIEFSQSEQDWLSQNHTIRVSYWQHPPYFYMNNGIVVGMAVDFLHEISARSGISFQYENRLYDFSDALNGLKTHSGPDLVGALMPTEERKQEILFTKPLINSPRFIFTREDAPFITSIKQLSGKSVAVVRDYAVHTHLDHIHPDIKLQIFNTNEEALRAVSFGKAFAFIGDLVSTPAMINEFGLNNLKSDCPSGQPDHILSIGIRNDWPELQSILNKTLDAIPANEKAAIVNKWTTVSVNFGLRPKDILKWIMLIFGAAVIVIGVFIFLNQRLKRLVEERTSTLSESEKRFRSTFEQAAVGMVHCDLEGTFLRINTKFCEISGYSLEELKDITFIDITHPGDLQKDIHYVNQLLSGEREYYSTEKRYICKNKETIWVNLTTNLVRNDSGDPLWFVAVIENIEARKEAEEEKRLSRERFEHIFQISPASITISKLATGEFIDVNQAFERDLGYSREEAIGSTSLNLKLWKNGEDRARLVPEFRKKGYLHVPALELVKKSGDTATFDSRFSLMMIGNVEHSIAVYFDITNQKEAEHQVKKYQSRLKALATELTLMEEKQRKQIATDLHDHVGQLLALSRLQLAALNAEMAKEEILQKLQPISAGLLQCIHAVRSAIFDLSSPQLNEIGLFAAVRDWLEEQVEEKYGILAELSGDNEHFPLDENLRLLLFRSIRELLMNVVKHAQATEVEVKIRKFKSSLSIVIKDNGTGFKYSPDMLQSKSAGFGLFSVQERMTDVGGSMNICTAPGKGTEVKIVVSLIES